MGMNTQILKQTTTDRATDKSRQYFLLKSALRDMFRLRVTAKQFALSLMPTYPL